MRNRVCLDLMENRKISCPCQYSKFSITQPVALSLYRLSYPDPYDVNMLVITYVRIFCLSADASPPVDDVTCSVNRPLSRNSLKKTMEVNKCRYTCI
jgi:hypothetical protein